MEILADLVITNVHSASRMRTGKRRGHQKESGVLGNRLEGRGRNRIFLCRKKYISNANKMMLLPAGSSYSWRCLEEGDFLDIEFEANFKHDKIFSFPIASSLEILKIFNELEYSRLMKEPFIKPNA